MNELATFFRNPTEDTGATYQFRVSTEHGPHEYFVYTRRRIHSGNFSDQELKHRDLESFQRDVKMTLRNQGGGGLIVVASGQGTSRNVEITPMPAGGYVPAGRFTVLRPGYPSHSLPTDGPAKISVGSHLLVPVDHESEEQLQTILNLLNWFSPDFEALVSNVIRRPALDARLSKIENHLFGQTAHATTEEAGLSKWERFLRRLRRFVTNPAVYGWGATSMLIALLALNAYLFHRVDSRLPVPVEEQKGVKDPGPGVFAPIIQSLTLPTTASRMRELMKEVRERGAHNDHLKLLYDVHFKQFESAAADDKTVDMWFMTQSANNGSRPLLLGLIKLQVLKLQPDVDGTTFLQQWESITATKSALKGVSNYRNDAIGLRLMSVLSCRLGYDSSPTPQLPGFSAGSPALVLMPDDRCDALGDKDIAAGLDHLITYVKSL